MHLLLPFPLFKIRYWFIKRFTYALDYSSLPRVQPLHPKTYELSPENDVGSSPQILAAVLFFHQVRGRPYAVFFLAILSISFKIPRVRFEQVIRTAVRAQRHYHFRASLRCGQKPWPIVIKTFVVYNTGHVNGGGGGFTNFIEYS